MHGLVKRWWKAQCVLIAGGRAGVYRQRAPVHALLSSAPDRACPTIMHSMCVAAFGTGGGGGECSVREGARKTRASHDPLLVREQALHAVEPSLP